MKILVIFTGGTIGSCVNNSYIGQDKNKPFKLINLYNNKDNFVFTTLTPYRILSENLTCDNLIDLITCVKAHILDDYDGIIVTHGTDTLQYSASALGYTLGNNCIPVILVSSNYVLEDKRANGLSNFACALEFIKNHYGRGVFVSYRNNDNKTYIHRATRLLAYKTYENDIFSVMNSYYGVFSENMLYCSNEKYTERNDECDVFNIDKLNNACDVFNIDKLNNACDILNTNKLSDKVNADYSLSNIMRIVPFPGISYPDITSSTRAVIHECYHSGTICSVSKSLDTFMKQATANNVPVFVTGVGNGIQYESVKTYDKLGMKVLPVASPIAMYIKLWLCSIAYSKSNNNENSIDKKYTDKNYIDKNYIDKKYTDKKYIDKNYFDKKYIDKNYFYNIMTKSLGGDFFEYN